MNKVHIYYQKGENVVNIPGHQIGWYFRFWSIETLNEAAYELYREAHGEDVTFFNLNSNEQQTIFNTIQPDYEGTNSETYGSITQSSTTDNDGIATSIYTAGIEEGFIEIIATDEQINISERGSWNLKKIKKKKENTSIKLNHIKIIPSSLKIYCGQSYNFTVKGYDRFGREIFLDPAKVWWITNCGYMIPSNYSVVSTFVSSILPKKDGKIIVYYESFTSEASVRVYPLIGEIYIDGERYNSYYSNGDEYYYIHLWVVYVKDTFCQYWGYYPEYPSLFYNYWVCGGNPSSGLISSPSYVFPTPYKRRDGNIWRTQIIETLYKFDDGSWGPPGPVSNVIWFYER